MQLVEYIHHGIRVKVKKALKGKHRDHCLCHICERFIPNNRAKNCPKANRVYKACKEEGLVLPVWECKADWFRIKKEV